MPSSKKGSAECGRPQPEAKLLTPRSTARTARLALYRAAVQVSFYNIVLGLFFYFSDHTKDSYWL